MTANPVGDAVRIHRRRRRNRILIVQCGRNSSGVRSRVACTGNAERRSDSPRSETIQVSVPPNASEISATNEGLEASGGCADLEFLIPVADWREYVAQYFSEKDMRPTYLARATCRVQRIECDEHPDFAINGSFNAGDLVVDGSQTYRRSLGVVPECKPGLARIALARCPLISSRPAFAHPNSAWLGPHRQTNDQHYPRLVTLVPL